jgi:hypothetical protein
MAKDTETKGFFYCDRNVAGELRQISTWAFKVYFVMASFMHEGEICFVNAGDLAEFIDMPLQKVDKAIFELISKGWIKRDRALWPDSPEKHDCFKLLKYVRFGERSGTPETCVASMRS